MELNQGMYGLLVICRLTSSKSKRLFSASEVSAFLSGATVGHCCIDQAWK